MDFGLLWGAGATLGTSWTCAGGGEALGLAATCTVGARSTAGLAGVLSASPQLIER